jgi:hypothetical protein
MGDPRVVSPMLYKAQLRLAYASMGAGQSEGSDPLNWESWELRPHDRSRWAMHGWVVAVLSVVCVSHRG